VRTIDAARQLQTPPENTVIGDSKNDQSGPTRNDRRVSGGTFMPVVSNNSIRAGDTARPERWVNASRFSVSKKAAPEL
jgi:hypothetical protein